MTDSYDVSKFGVDSIEGDIKIARRSREAGEKLENGILIVSEIPKDAGKRMKGGILVAGNVGSGGMLAGEYKTYGSIGYKMKGGIAIASFLSASAGYNITGGVALVNFETTTEAELGKYMEGGIAIASTYTHDAGEGMRGGLLVSEYVQRSIGSEMDGGVAIAGRVIEKIGKRMNGGIIIANGSFLRWDRPKVFVEDKKVKVVKNEKKLGKILKKDRTALATTKEKFEKVIEEAKKFYQGLADLENELKICGTDTYILKRLMNEKFSGERIKLPGLKTVEKGKKDLCIGEISIGNAHNYKEVWSKRIETLKNLVLDMVPGNKKYQKYVEKQFDTIWK